MMKTFILFSLLVCGVFCDDDLNDPELVKKANKHMDLVLENSKKEDGSFPDPLKLEDKGIGFEKDVPIFGKIKGEAKVYDGHINGLSQLKRKEDCKAIKVEEDDGLFDCRLQVDQLKGGYKAGLFTNDVSLGPKLGIDILITKTIMRVKYGAFGKDKTAAMISAEVEDIGKVAVKTNGLGILYNFAASIFTSLVLNALEIVLRKVMDKQIAPLFEKEIAKIPYTGETLFWWL